jgi:hypothetical protein
VNMTGRFKDHSRGRQRLHTRNQLVDAIDRSRNTKLLMQWAAHTVEMRLGNVNANTGGSRLQSCLLGPPRPALELRINYPGTCSGLSGHGRGDQRCPTISVDLGHNGLPRPAE